MGFSEATKLNIKRKADFRCCLCHNIGVEIHHIVPQAECGSDTEDNAAPLCPSCHEIYGANPEKRKFIREVREFWFEVCERKHASDPSLLQDIKAKLQETVSKHDLEQALDVIVSRIDNIVHRDAVIPDRIDSDNKLVSIHLPEKYWVLILAALEPIIQNNVKYIKSVAGDGLGIEATQKYLESLPEEVVTALAGPVIIRSVIVEEMAKIGVMKPEAANRFGTHAIQKAIDNYNTDLKAHQQQILPKKVARNDKCTCGSGRKYKNCCGKIGKIT